MKSTPSVFVTRYVPCRSKARAIDPSGSYYNISYNFRFSMTSALQHPSVTSRPTGSSCFPLMCSCALHATTTLTGAPACPPNRAPVRIGDCRSTPFTVKRTCSPIDQKMAPPSRSTSPSVDDSSWSPHPTHERASSLSGGSVGARTVEK